MIVLEKVYSQKLIEDLKVAHEKHFEKWYMSNVINTTKSEQRAKDGFEVLLPMIPPFSSKEFVQSPFLLPVIEAVVNAKRLEINMFSSVTSLPGAPTQHWHRDAGALFEYDEFPYSLPCHGALMFVPLVDLVKENGATEFYPKAHHQCHSKDRTDLHDGGNRQLLVCPFVKERMMVTGKRGTVILFDYRMLHRGGPNNSDEPRSVMYLSWVREWWVDRINYNAQPTRVLDNLTGPKVRKLLSRIDSKHYYEKLDDAVLENNLDFPRSKFHYHSHNYDVVSEL